MLHVCTMWYIYNYGVDYYSIAFCLLIQSHTCGLNFMMTRRISSLFF